MVCLRSQIPVNVYFYVTGVGYSVNGGEKHSKKLDFDRPCDTIKSTVERQPVRILM